MSVIVELALRPEEAAGEDLVREQAIRLSGISAGEVSRVVLRKRSLDARSKQVVFRLRMEVFRIGEVIPVDSERRKFQVVHQSEPVAIIGCGPAGLFAAIRLIELGYKPVIIERGKPVRERRRDLAKLNRGGEVNPNSNYCFGEGGAGTYSDGKLYTRSDKRGNVRRILDTFVEFGASPDITIDAHPHIGTNKLPDIISAMSNRIRECGGEIIFNCRFTGFVHDGKKITGVRYREVEGNDAENILDVRAVIVAPGHSSRDMYRYLHEENILIHAKPFALGVRAEHPQSVIDRIRYHCDVRHPLLPPASYTLTTQASGRGVYSFCMCPGGIIAPAATAPGEVVVNGWSPSKRNNPFANSGMVVAVGEEDFYPFRKYGELRAMMFQQSVEQRAFSAGRGNLKAPAQRMTDFISKKVSSSLPNCSYHPGITPSSLDEVLTGPVATALRDGLIHFQKQVRGYVTDEAVLVATESRTSSPVQIPRDKKTMMHPQLSGFFPCGEGAGQAGGIVSAAVDGERSAEGCVAFLQNS